MLQTKSTFVFDHVSYLPTKPHRMLLSRDNCANAATTSSLHANIITWTTSGDVLTTMICENNHAINIRWCFDHNDLHFEQVFKRERSKGLFHYNAGTFGVNSLKYRWWVCCQLNSSCLCLQILICVIRTKFMNVWWLV